ncbi:PKD domain-containing protein [Draconibacterium sp. IB214405]|uniref:PKD domain-containing protein n=1 Tax=Draconibacterium sp. IB214405 TaxID=3097352 RepID=UPI002A101195|nr:PKD domain-containing protein [Draconibacterium sp. IB214405]MDX8341080.1 PKD domain-containing protein [Draconibacterium sp. IB214405]
MKNRFKILTFSAVLAIAFTACNDDDPANVAAGFTITPEDNIQVGDTVFFSNTSTEALTFVWSFGDGETSTEADPFHIYNEPGVYDVTLVAANGDLTDMISRQVNVAADLTYIINYGSYSGDKATVSAYNKYTDEVINEYYTSVNGVNMVSNVQYAYNYNGNIYMMGNNSDQVFWVDNKTFEQTSNAITEGIVKPRYCVGQDDYLYVSCWGGDIWADESLSYIAKIDLSSKTVESTIVLPGGPEGLEIANDKLYAALNYKDSVAVIDLNTDAVSYIETPAVSSYFLKDASENLYVSFVSTFSDYSESAGLGYINTTNNELEATYVLPGVSTSYVNLLEPNADFSKLYLMTSAYDANWNLSGAVAVFDVAAKSFESENLIEGVLGLNGVAFYDGKLFTFVSESATSNGKVVTYLPDGTQLSEYETGISPFMLLEIEN